MLTPMTKIDLPSYIYSFHSFFFLHIKNSTIKSNPGVLVLVIRPRRERLKKRIFP